MHCRERPEGDVGTQALELPALVSNLTGVVGTEFRSSARATRTLKLLSASPAPLTPYNKNPSKGTSCQLPFQEPETCFTIYLTSWCLVVCVHYLLPRLLRTRLAERVAAHANRRTSNPRILGFRSGLHYPEASAATTLYSQHGPTVRLRESQVCGTVRGSGPRSLGKAPRAASRSLCEAWREPGAR